MRANFGNIIGMAVEHGYSTPMRGKIISASVDNLGAIVVYVLSNNEKGYVHRFLLDEVRFTSPASI